VERNRGRWSGKRLTWDFRKGGRGNIESQESNKALRTGEKRGKCEEDGRLAEILFNYETKLGTGRRLTFDIRLGGWCIHWRGRQQHERRNRSVCGSWEKDWVDKWLMMDGLGVKSTRGSSAVVVVVVVGGRVMAVKRVRKWPFYSPAADFELWRRKWA
jgi:hypothetical protein